MLSFINSLVILIFALVFSFVILVSFLDKRRFFIIFIFISEGNYIVIKNFVKQYWYIVSFQWVCQFCTENFKISNWILKIYYILCLILILFIAGLYFLKIIFHLYLFTNANCVINPIFIQLAFHITKFI
jgi:hypothetical protein